MARSPPPRRPPELMEELVEEILLRLPPDEPAYLVRAALVCKLWCRIFSDCNFRRRFREFHRSPPLLGYINKPCFDSDGKAPRIVPTTSTASIPFFSLPVLKHWWAVDSRHGRVLIISYQEPHIEPVRLIVWDPITGSQKHLTVPDYPHTVKTGAVLCAVDGCNHLDCHGGPFRVVSVSAEYVEGVRLTWVNVYTSETCQWSAPTYIRIDSHVVKTPSLLMGDALYFLLQFGMHILRYDLSKHALSLIGTPRLREPVTVEDGDGGFC
ncbi:hypothetical protein EJB05_14225, partial [Eragrostis curvula]